MIDILDPEKQKVRTAGASKSPTSLTANSGKPCDMGTCLKQVHDSAIILGTAEKTAASTIVLKTYPVKKESAQVTDLANTKKKDDNTASAEMGGTTK